MNVNILFSSAGRRSYLVKWFKKAMIKEGIAGTIHVANSKAISPAFLEADKTVVTPMIYSHEYIPFILEYCHNYDINIVIPLFDLDVTYLSYYKGEFNKNGIKLLVPDYDIVNICNDKYLSSLVLKNNAIGVPKTYINIELLKSAIEKGTLKYPVIIKPRYGCGSISVFRAFNDKEVLFLYEFVKQQIEKTYLNHQIAQEEDTVIIQEELNGDEYGLDIICDLEGKYINTIVKKKIAMRSGETDGAITVSNKDLQDIGKSLSEILPHPGVMDVDMFVANGISYVLECNARFGGGYPFSHVAGADVPRAIIRWLMKKNANELCYAQNGILSQKDIHMIKYKRDQV